MAIACIKNWNGYGLGLAKRLIATNRIEKYWSVDKKDVCFEFRDRLTISLDDLYKVLPPNNLVPAEAVEEVFKSMVVSRAIETLKGGEIIDYSSRRVVLQDTTKNETICIRLSIAEKEELIKKATELNTTISEYVRKSYFHSTPKLCSLFLSPLCIVACKDSWPKYILLLLSWLHNRLLEEYTQRPPLGAYHVGVSVYTYLLAQKSYYYSYDLR